jgi:hypothetical protein
MLRKREKQISREVGKNKTKNETKKFQRYEQGAFMY